ncbi:MAG: hypothetical protein OXH68_02680 [Gammaproteobacteria bacterium]|nr:hypothetical protein [Gammaproteobacteria bacterium]
MSFDQTLAVASAQMRSARRSIRTWVFGVLAGGTTIAVGVFFAYAHGVLGSANAGRFGPRFLIAELGGYLLWLLLVGVVFMAFDLRNGDVRARIAEALDTRPVSNLAMIAGRALGVAAAVALPVLGTVALLQVLGTAARAADFWMGDPIEPVSLASFVLLDVLVAIFVWSATVLLLSSVLRNRLAVVLAAALLLALQFWAMTTVPAYLLPAVSVVANSGGWASDITTQFADLDHVLQRSVVLVGGVGICLLAAALHPRPAGGSRFRLSVLGTVVVLVAVAGLSAVALRGVGTVEKRAGWLAVHRGATTETTRWPDIERITGTAKIDPGDRLNLDIDLHLRANDAEIPSWVFSFNPGLRLTDLRHGGEAIPFVHESGLLTVEGDRLKDVGPTFVLSMQAQGVPDPDFGYLDSAVDWRRRPGTNLLKYLGTAASVFHRNYAALTPAVHWLPASGSNVDREDPSRRPPDFFHLDLLVEVPAGWMVAGPGRQPHGEDAARIHRLRTDSPIQEAALFASDFERRMVNVLGIELELLVTPKHMPNLEHFAEAGDEITKQLTNIFAKLEGADLAYPERVLSLVEVPTSLRTYRGGWRMDAVRTPGVLLLREEGLPTIRTGHYGGEVPADRRQGYLVSVLHIYFLNAWNSGNSYQGLAGNLIASTSPVDTGAVALDAVTRDLAYRVLNPWGSEGSVWFSAHSYDADAVFGTSVWDMVAGLATGHFGSMLGRTSWWRGDMWGQAARTSVARIDGGNDPHLAFSLLSLKGNALEDVVLGVAGVQKTGEVLGELRRRYEGRPFAMDDFLVVADEAVAGLSDVVDEALHEPGLPGFLASPATVVPLSDDDAGRPRYHVAVHVYNGEPVAGWLQLAEYGYGRGEGDPIRVPGQSSIEIGRVYDTPPDQLWLHPYLSLNRHEIRLDLVGSSPRSLPDEDGFVGTRPSTWTPPPVDGIVVDDLDAGFSWESAAKRAARWSLVDRYRGWTETLDHGLPVRASEAGAWIRHDVGSAWGTYRRTVAMAFPGGTHDRVFFTAELDDGPWRLDYYLPERRIPERWAGDRELVMYGQLGSMRMKLIAFDNADAVPGTSPAPLREWTLDFDAAHGETGWNKLGEFDLPGGPARLEVSNVTNGQVVIADAVRWRRVE